MIQPNKSSALVALNIMMMTEGEIVTVKYTNSFGHLDFLVAIGTGTGVGPRYYSILSDQSKIIISRIVDSLPDIAEGVFGKIFLLQENGRFYRCLWSREERIWDKEPVNGDWMVHNLEDSWLYYLKGDEGIIERLSFSKYEGGGDGLKVARKINGTDFDGKKDIITETWGTPRKFFLTDGDNFSDPVKVNGGEDVVLNLPDLITTKVTRDSQGRNIVETYATKDELGNLDVSEKIQEAIDNLDVTGKIDTALENLNVDGKIQEAVKDLDVTDKINSAIQDLDVDGKIQDSLGNLDITGEVNQAIEGIDIDGKINNYLQGNEGVMNLIRDKVSESLENTDLEEIIQGIDFTPQIETLVDNWFKDNQETIVDYCKPAIDEIREELKSWCNDVERVIANALIRHEQWIQEHSS